MSRVSRRESHERSERASGTTATPRSGERSERGTWPRRKFLEAVGVAGALGLAGCSGDPDTDDETATPTATPTSTATETATPTPTQVSEYDGVLGFESMLEATPTHPDLAPSEYVWARHVNVGGVLASVEDRSIEARLRSGWLGSGPPLHADSDAFELVHVQSRGIPNVTFGYGDFETASVVEAMVDDDWNHEGGRAGFDRLEQGGYTTAVGEATWLVMRTAGGTIDGLIDAVGTDPLTGRLDDVDAEAMTRTAAEDGGYHVLERSEPAGYAAGIAVEYAPHRPPVGVMQYAANRESPTWERVEVEFEERIAGEVRRSAFGEEFA
ncbi:hypothetical protein [Haloplanus salilacus]|uniref:hypothetical protein n=1 Tax=Haloplanus salilacus TaxID=2949994 RepID=UPI0030CE105F